jgi:putative tricarboxylic transport membrane protein
VAKESTIKGLISGCIGLFTANIGMDPFCEYYRFTFDIDALLGGINLVALLVGLFALSEMFMQIEKGGLDIKPNIKIFRAPLSSVREVLGRILNLLRSSSIGTFIGALPGAGMVIASFVSYAMAKAVSKNPKEFGKGATDGIIASEAGNNSCCGGALIPTLAMAIPGDPTSACLLSALLLLGFFPGPELFNSHKDVVGGIFLAYMSANFFLLILGILFTPFFVAILKLKKNRLIPIILLLATIGTYALESSIFDLELMIIFGLLGYLMRRNGFPLAPLIIAHVLGPLMETNFRRALIISDERMDIFFTRPLCAVILAINVLLLLWTMLPPLMLSRIRKRVWNLVLPRK